MENNNTLSSNLERIKNAVDEIRDNIGGETIEEVAENSAELVNIEDYFDTTKDNGGFTETVGRWCLWVKKLVPTKMGSWLRMFIKFQGTDIDFSKIGDHTIYSFESAFSGCSNIKSIDLSRIISTMSGNSFSSTFSWCSNLETLNIYCDLSIIRGTYSSSSYFNDCFSGCSKLTNLTFGINFGKGFTSGNTTSGYANLDLSSCSLLTHESLMSVINGLYDITSKGLGFTPYVKLHADAYARLSSEEIQIATDKGWNVISA